MFQHDSYEEMDTITIKRDRFVTGLNEYVRACPITRWHKVKNGWQIKITGNKKARGEVVGWIIGLYYGYLPKKEEYKEHLDKLNLLIRGDDD